ncbi:MAG: hypothetical protein ACJA13_001209 [Paraglaciecola sp.]|jgi:hypothetical protein
MEIYMKKLVASLVLVLCSVNAQAILLTDLINGGSITVGDKVFDDWEVLSTFSYDDRFDTDNITDNIDVTGMNDGGLDPGPGLRYDISNGLFDLTGDGLLDFMFGFSVTVLDPLLRVKDNSLSLTDFEIFPPVDLSSIFIEELVFADDRMTQLGSKNVEASELSDGNGGFTSTAKLQDSAVFAPQSSIYVTTNILLEAFDPGERVLLTGFEQRFSQTSIDVPEPHAFMLWGAGLLIWVARRRQRK